MPKVTDEKTEVVVGLFCEEVCAKAWIPDCKDDDCFFAAAGALARRQAEGR